MASNDAAKVLVGRPKVSGAIFSAPLGTELPTDAAAALDAAFVGLGYASEDGLESNYTRDSEEIREWGGKIVKRPQTDVTDEYTVTLIQSGSPDVLKEVYGDANVTVTAATSSTGELVSIKASGEPLPSKCWIFEMADGNAKRRLVLPNAQITAVDSTSFQRGAVVSYPVTITAFPDEDGNSHYEYLDDGVFSA